MILMASQRITLLYELRQSTKDLANLLIWAEQDSSNYRKCYKRETHACDIVVPSVGSLATEEVGQG